MSAVITEGSIERRKFWIEEIIKLSGSFSDDSDRLEKEISEELKSNGAKALIDHLRLCGDIPERYGHDSSEEKLYSKYSDSILAEAFKALGLKSLVLKERADAADVEAFGSNYSLVADAKTFRLSRTAKNQKDFKIQAMDGWKRGKPYAMVVCPIYQLPNKSSQIYEQATSRNVCIFTFSHLSVLVNFAELEGKPKAERLLRSIFQTIPALIPSKNASEYWLAINKVMLEFSSVVESLWMIEKRAASESISIAKEESLVFLAREREKIMRMSHCEALTELIKVHKIESRIKMITSVSENGILEIR